MSNSTVTFDAIVQSQASKEVTANAFFDAVSPASFFGRRQSTTTGLTWGYYGGNIIVDGVLTQIANGTLALTASATNYIEITRAGVISKNTTGFTPGSIPLYSVVVGASTITSYIDYRMLFQPNDMTRNASQAVTTADVTLTANQARCRYITVTGAMTANRALIVPANWEGIINNQTTGGYELTVKTAAGAGIATIAGMRVVIYTDGTNAVELSQFPSTKVTSIDVSAADVTISGLQTKARQLTLTGSLTANRALIVPNNWEGIVYNNTTGAFVLTVKTAAGSGIPVASTMRALLFADGTNVVRITADA